ncbi:MAG: hypothetical protein ACRDZ2_08110 [Ilumatobacteraceae bacterium]
MAALVAIVAPAVADAQSPDPPPPPPPPPSSAPALPPPAPPPLSMVLEQVVQGDLVMAGAVSQPRAGRAADVDGETGVLCLRRASRTGRVCDDNSSRAVLDLPAGASVIAARLYVSTSLTDSVNAMVVRLAGPADGGAYATVGAAARLDELSAAGHRQAVWDVTELVRQRGAGEYTIADIANEAVSGSAYASWTIVAAYELAGDLDASQLPPEVQPRFARRALSWHDGLATTADGPVVLEVGGFTLPMDRPVVAKSMHVITSIEGGYDNVLFAGSPLGNNATPGDVAPPAGVVIGTDPLCNTTVDVANGSICTLGTPAKPPVPGAAVDMDVVRVPDRYLVPGATTAEVSVVAEGLVAASVLAVSVEQPVEVAP